MQTNEALSRAFKQIDKLDLKLTGIEQRLGTLERLQPLQQQTNRWVMTSVWIAAGAAVMFVAKKRGSYEARQVTELAHRLRGRGAHRRGRRLSAHRIPLPSRRTDDRMGPYTRGARMGDACTQEQADRWLLDDATEMADGVRGVLKRERPALNLARWCRWRSTSG